MDKAFDYKNYGIKSILKVLAASFLEEKTSDFIIWVNSRRFPCHRVLLATHSEYLSNMYDERCRKQEIKLEGISAEAFYLVIKFFYKSELDLGGVKIDQIFDIVHAVQKFGFVILLPYITEYLEKIINNSNVSLINRNAIRYSMDGLAQVCEAYIENHGKEVKTESSAE